MTKLEDGDVVAIRNHVHDINNALNVISMQSELVKLLAADSASAEKIVAAVDTVLSECVRAGDMAVAISSTMKARQ